MVDPTLSEQAPHSIRPSPRILPRPFNQTIYQEARAQGALESVALWKASRPGLCLQEPELARLDHPARLWDCQKAADRIHRAVRAGERIALETDHDCDGQTAHAILYQALTAYFHYPPEKIASYIGHRLKEGYGLSQKLAQRILNDPHPVSLVITADNGSSDEDRIAQLRAAGIDVIVTDHHEIPESGIPQSAYAVLNPTQPGCDYPDPCIAGCMVAWLLMAQLRQTLIQAGDLPQNAPSLIGLLDYVALGTIADCVSMARSLNNRAVVRAGLKLMRQKKRPCWQIIAQSYPHSVWDDEFLAFTLGPLLNSDGRLHTALGSVSFLLSQTLSEAQAWLEHLQSSNQERKDLQKALLREAEEKACALYARGYVAYSIYCAQGHPGIHGIIASKIKERFGVPCAMLAPKNGSLEHGITASVRGVPGLHIREALVHIAQNHPDLFVAFGGHSGAAGFTLRPGVAVERFAEAFQEAIIKQIDAKNRGEGPSIVLGPVLYSDGLISPEHFTLEHIEAFDAACRPFGRECEAPIFEGRGRLIGYKAMGLSQEHFRVEAHVEGAQQRWYPVSFLWFFAQKVDSLRIEQPYRFFYTPKISFFREKKRVEWQLVHIAEDIIQ